MSNKYSIDKGGFYITLILIALVGIVAGIILAVNLYKGEVIPESYIIEQEVCENVTEIKTELAGKIETEVVNLSSWSWWTVRDIEIVNFIVLNVYRHESVIVEENCDFDECRNKGLNKIGFSEIDIYNGENQVYSLNNGDRISIRNEQDGLIRESYQQMYGYIVEVRIYFDEWITKEVTKEVCHTEKKVCEEVCEKSNVEITACDMTTHECEDKTETICKNICTLKFEEKQ